MGARPLATSSTVLATRDARVSGLLAYEIHSRTARLTPHTHTHTHTEHTHNTEHIPQQVITAPLPNSSTGTCGCRCFGRLSQEPRHIRECCGENGTLAGSVHHPPDGLGDQGPHQGGSGAARKRLTKVWRHAQVHSLDLHLVQLGPANATKGGTWCGRSEHACPHGTLSAIYAWCSVRKLGRSQRCWNKGHAQLVCLATLSVAAAAELRRAPGPICLGSVYGGKARGRHQPRRLCLLNAALVDGTPPTARPTGTHPYEGLGVVVAAGGAVNPPKTQGLRGQLLVSRCRRVPGFLLPPRLPAVQPIKVTVFKPTSSATHGHHAQARTNARLPQRNPWSPCSSAQIPKPQAAEKSVNLHPTQGETRTSQMPALRVWFASSQARHSARECTTKWSSSGGRPPFLAMLLKDSFSVSLRFRPRNRARNLLPS
jgi:hypothetical protein